MTKNQLIIEGKRDLANYYFDREFAETDFEMLKDLQELSGYKDTINIIQPSDKFYYKEFLINNSDYKKYPTLENLRESEESNLIEDFDIYLEERQDENYPIWSAVFHIKGGSWSSEIYNERIDELADIGIGLLEFRDEYYLFIAGGNYDFYEAHWIPLFTKFFKWIEE